MRNGFTRVMSTNTATTRRSETPDFCLVGMDIASAPIADVLAAFGLAEEPDLFETSESAQNLLSEMGE